MPRGKAKGKDRHGPARIQEEAGGGEAWLATYADAITLMMAFFMMLYAMSQIDQVKFESLISGFAVPFGNDATGHNAGRDSILDSGLGIVGDTTPMSDPMSDPMQRALETAPRADASDAATGLPLLAQEQLEEVRDRVAEAIGGQGLGDDVRFQIDQRGLIISISADSVLFPSGSAEFQATGREVIAKMAPVLAEFGNGIHVEGHTDDTPLRRGSYTNWNLSTDRAIAVVDLMTTRHGIAPERMAATGFGEFRPDVPNDSPQNRAHNRRVEIVIVAGGSL